MRTLIILLCLLAAVAVAQPSAIPPCDLYGPPAGFTWGISIAETPHFAIQGVEEQYGCILPFSPVNEGYLGIFEDPGHTVLSDYVHFVNVPGVRAEMYLYSEVEGTPLTPPGLDASVTEIGPEGANYAIYEVPGFAQYKFYSDVPEPSTLLLAGAALVLVGLLKRKLA